MRFSQEQKEKYLSTLGSSTVMKDQRKTQSGVDYKTRRETAQEYFF